MAWVKIDDGAPDHPKFLRLAELAQEGDKGAAAAWLWTCGLAYCNRQKAHDGFIPRVKVAQLYPVRSAVALALRLVEVGLWEVVEGGYLVHDYHDYQPQAEQSAETSAKRSEAGRLGGLRSGEARRLKQAEASGKQTGEAKTNPVPSRPVLTEEDPPVAPVKPTEAKRQQPTQQALLEPTGAPVYRFDFDRVFHAYPKARRTGKSAGLAHVAGEIKSEADYRRFYGTALHVAERAASGDIEEQYIPQWVNFCKGKWLQYEPEESTLADVIEQTDLAAKARARMKAGAAESERNPFPDDPPPRSAA